MFCHLLLPVMLALQIDAGKEALKAHDYGKAAEEFRAVLAASEGVAGEESVALEALGQLAAVSRLLGHADDAERALTRAVPLAVKLSGGTSLESFTASGTA